jgi:hypothetical protein
MPVHYNQTDDTYYYVHNSNEPHYTFFIQQHTPLYTAEEAVRGGIDPMSPTVEYLERKKENTQLALNHAIATGLESRVRYCEDQIIELDKQIQEELSKPTEESLGLEEDAVLWFQVRFGGSLKYTYAACRIPALGKWCVTGPRDSSYYTFRELYDKYLKKAMNEEFGIQYATKWKQVL